MKWLPSEDTRIDDKAAADRYSKYLVSGAELIYLSFPECDILSQALVFEQYRIVMMHYFVTTDLPVSVLTERPMVMLHFMIEGDLVAQSSPDSLDCRAGWYQMLYVPANKLFSISPAPGHAYSIYVDLDHAFLERLSNGIPQLSQMASSLKEGDATGRQFLPAAIDYRVKTLVSEITDVNQDEPGRELYVHSKVCELIWHYARQLNPSMPPELNGAYLSKLLGLRNFIIGNLDLPLGTSYFAGRFQMSVTSLKRQFKLYTGKSIREFITEQRMERAMEIVLHSQQSISSIGSQLGYSEFSSFTRAFTRYFGQSPNHFRK